MCQSVELEAQTLTQQSIPNSTSNSTRLNKAKSVESKTKFKVGDRATIKAGGLSGRVGNIKDIAGNIATVTSPTFGMEQKIPLAHLERAI